MTTEQFQRLLLMLEAIRLAVLLPSAGKRDPLKEQEQDWSDYYSLRAFCQPSMTSGSRTGAACETTDSASKP